MTQALLVIDLQKAFNHASWGKRNNPQAESHIKAILADFRAKHLPIIHIQHISDKPQSLFHDTENQAFKEGFEPLSDETVFQKRSNSAFIGTNLENHLRTQQINQVVIVGLTLPHCVSTTTRMAANLGFKVTLVADATASFALEDMAGQSVSAEALHYYNLVALHQEFATIIQTATLLS